MERFKFRGWDKTESEWVDIKNIRLDGNDIWYVMTQDEFEKDIDPPFFPERDQLVLMQYTGLKDRNGVEIYEDDILEFADKNFLVIWEDYRFNLKNFYEFYLDYPTEAFSESLQFKVVGNIHEHPHLIEEERT